jgi:hypothetical protein
MSLCVGTDGIHVTVSPKFFIRTERVDLICCFLAIWCLCFTCAWSNVVKSIPVVNRPHEAYSLEFLHTRYRAGCYLNVERNYSEKYNIISPFLYNFDKVITFCDVDWMDPGAASKSDSCIFEMDRHYPVFGVHRDDLADRIHVMGERHHLETFFSLVYPQLEKEYDKTGKGIILHTGGADQSMRADICGNRILSARAIVRWVVEQNVDEAIRKHPKVVQLPIGLCFRETTLGAGKELRLAISESQPAYANSKLNIGDPVASGMVDFSKYLASKALNFSDWKRQQPLAWSARRDRVLLCWTERGNRVKFSSWAKDNCSYCDICNRSIHASYNHYDLWQEYRRYKFVLSPFGNGPDCFRTSEILLMGAIPIIEFFEGAYAYRDAGFKTIHIHKPEDLNEANFSRWQHEMTSGNDNITGLTREYWNRKAFASDPSWGLHRGTSQAAGSESPTVLAASAGFALRVPFIFENIECTLGAPSSRGAFLDALAETAASSNEGIPYWYVLMAASLVFSAFLVVAGFTCRLCNLRNRLLRRPHLNWPVEGFISFYRRVRD